MAVALGVALQLLGKVRQRDDVLAAGHEVAQLDLAVLELIAHDDREMRAVLAGAFQLATELPPREVGPDPQPRRPEILDRASKRSMAVTDGSAMAMGLRVALQLLAEVG